MTNTRQLEIQLLEGEQAGARAAIQPDTVIIIGDDANGDIVLRDTQFKNFSFRFLYNINIDLAQVEVLLGSIEIQGEKIVKGHNVDLPPYVPLKIGQTSLAYGFAEDQQWAALSPSTDVALQPQMGLVNLAAETSRRQNSSPIKKYHSMLLWSTLVLLGVGLIGMNWFNETNVPVVQSQTEIATNISRELKDSGFLNLTVKESAENGLTVHGYLETKIERLRLEKMLKDANIFAQPRVVVEEQLAETVQDIYRINGIKAEVQSQGAGIVQVKTAIADLEQLNQVMKIAKQDIVGLRDIVTENEKPDQEPSKPTLTVDDPGKRVASIMPGSPAYIVTIDGARYFVGAMMPSGHKISAIFDQQLLLEKNGTTTTLNF